MEKWSWRGGNAKLKTEGWRREWTHTHESPVCGATGRCCYPISDDGLHCLYLLSRRQWTVILVIVHRGKRVEKDLSSLSRRKDRERGRERQRERPYCEGLLMTSPCSKIATVASPNVQSEGFCSPSHPITVRWELSKQSWLV